MSYVTYMIIWQFSVSDDFVVPKTIPMGLALKKTLFPCKIHELYFVSQEALTEHFMSEHWGGFVEPASVLPHIKRGQFSFIPLKLFCIVV